MHTQVRHKLIGILSGSLWLKRFDPGFSRNCNKRTKVKNSTQKSTTVP